MSHQMQCSILGAAVLLCHTSKVDKASTERIVVGPVQFGNYILSSESGRRLVKECSDYSAIPKDQIVEQWNRTRFFILDRRMCSPNEKPHLHPKRPTVLIEGVLQHIIKGRSKVVITFEEVELVAVGSSRFYEKDEKPYRRARIFVKLGMTGMKKQVAGVEIELHDYNVTGEPLIWSINGVFMDVRSNKK